MAGNPSFLAHSSFLFVHAPTLSLFTPDLSTVQSYTYIHTSHAQYFSLQTAWGNQLYLFFIVQFSLVLGKRAVNKVYCAGLSGNTMWLWFMRYSFIRRYLLWPAMLANLKSVSFFLSLSVPIWWQLVCPFPNFRTYDQYVLSNMNDYISKLQSYSEDRLSF